MAPNDERVDSANPSDSDEAFWREYLTRGDAGETRARRVLKLLPHGPRCKLCAAPFAGPAAPVMRAIGKRQPDGGTGSDAGLVLVRDRRRRSHPVASAHPTPDEESSDQSCDDRRQDGREIRRRMSGVVGRCRIRQSGKPGA